jgi:serine/threonine-protein kinase
MSPEQARGDKTAIDARSDPYSAFVVLFELLTLHRFVREEGNVYATLKEVIAGRTLAVDGDEWLHPKQPAVPVEWRHFIRQGLQRDPERRYQSATEVIEMVEQIRSGKLPVMCPITFYKSIQHRIADRADASPRAFMVSMSGLALAMLGLIALAGVGLASLV